ncbi:MAG: orotidine-5'-phosphate decarboxylase [Actinomycetota bacterium]
MARTFEPALKPLILALDTPDLDAARRISGRVREQVDIVKVGLQLFSAEGRVAIDRLKQDGFEVFLDLKLIDIPNTVAAACRALCEYEPLMLTVHTMGGQEMMRAAAAAVAEECGETGRRRPLLIGVTVLTSFDLLTLKKVGIPDSVEDEVLRLAVLARDSGMDGLVTSPLETLPVRREVGEEMLLVTPGVRPKGAKKDDQKRVASPREAMRDGADFLVVGRPITTSEQPAEVAASMLEEATTRTTDY